MAKYIDNKLVVSGGSAGFLNLQNPIDLAKLMKLATDESPQYKIQSNNISYDPTVSALTSTTVKDAIDEIATEYLYTELDITSPEILAMGTTPIELLAAPGAGKYYNYFGIIEYTFGTAQYNFGTEFLAVVGSSSFSGNYLSNSGFSLEGNPNLVFKINSDNPEYINAANGLSIKESQLINESIILTTYGGTDPTLGDGTFKVKLWWKMVDFG